MISMQALGWLLFNLVLFTVMAFGVAAAAARLFSLLRHSFCGCHSRDTFAAVVTGIIIAVTLALLLEVPFMQILPMLIYVTYMVMGLVHMCLWSRQLLAMFASVVREPECDCPCKKPCEPGPMDPCGCGAPRGCCPCHREKDSGCGS